MDESRKARGLAGRWGKTAGVLGAGALAGAVLAGVVGAHAATTTPSTDSSSTSSTSSGAGPDGQMQGNFPAHGTAAHEALEKPVTGAAATSAQAAAVKALGGGQAGEVTTDATGTGYEVTVTKSDGTTTEIHLNSSFAVQGGPGGHGPGGHSPAGNAAPDTAADG
jgi:hypothetical protein